MATAAQTIARASTSALSALIDDVTFDSQITPTVRVSPFAPSASSGSGIGDMILGWVRPRITIKPRAGSPIVYAPAGNPDANYLPALIVGSVVVVGGALGTAFLLGRWSAPRRR